jgi:uncharacterized protein with von Willebrand factor type A (vWA) domain
MFGFLKKKKQQIGALTDEDLKSLDVIILVDHSGSMDIESHRCLGTNRLGEVQEDVYKTAQVAEKFDSDGLTVIPFSSGAQVFDKVGSLNVASVFKAFKPDGSTNLTAALEAAVAKAEATAKNVVVLVYTDGRPDSMASAKLVIDRAGRDLGRPKIGFTFVQVGNDSAASAFLDELDTQMTVDLCATVRAQDATNLTFHQLAWLAQNA